MVTKILIAVQNTVRKYPNAIQQGVAAVRKATDWVNAQPFGNELRELYRRVSFNVNLGSFPDIGVNDLRLAKQSGSLDINGTSSGVGNGSFRVTLAGAIRAVQLTAQNKRSDASAKATAAKAAAAEAQRLAAEAARLAEYAEAEAATFEGAASAFANAR